LQLAPLPDTAIDPAGLLDGSGFCDGRVKTSLTVTEPVISVLPFPFTLNLVDPAELLTLNISAPEAADCDTIKVLG
jgi:hypothetical protein